jgi:hypothetical protein
MNKDRALAVLYYFLIAIVVAAYAGIYYVGEINGLR